MITAEKMYLFMENETLKEKITELKEGKKKKKIYPTTPKKSGTKKKGENGEKASEKN
ncbi:MAG: hypothetical protein PVG65_00335 [Candidatus Thorarchaeota archaeon]